MLQSEAGYIDARPHIRQLDEVLLQRTAGPYIRVRSRPDAVTQATSALPLKADIRDLASTRPLCARRRLMQRSKTKVRPSIFGSLAPMRRTG
jgi:hypothetical protein